MKMIFFILFAFCALSFAYAAERADTNTPLISEYKKRYEANKNTFNIHHLTHLINKDCEKRCSQKDNNNMEALAEKGDMLGISMAMIKNWDKTKSVFSNTKTYADKGDPLASVYLAAYYNFSKKDYLSAEKYILKAKEKDFWGGYLHYAYLNGKLGKIKEFCEANEAGYKRFGLEFLAVYYIIDGYNSKTFFSRCVKKSKDEILADKGDEGKLIRGYILVKKERYREAYKIFRELYKPGDGSKISANAGYCLGMMKYSGKGVEKNLAEGTELLKESFNNGVFVADDINYSLLETNPLPEKLEIISYTAGTCNHIK